MKIENLMTEQPLVGGSDLAALATLPELTEKGHRPNNTVRHILLGNPERVQQTIYLLHTLRYSETGLWSPVMAVAQPLTIIPAPGEAMSLLRLIV